ncbi:MAG: ComF family protein [Clostridiales bacterium]|nr:ComF family protein [Clostridiales bacterium]
MAIIDLFFPSHIKCIFCGEETKAIAICDKCYASLPFITAQKCLKCGGVVKGDGGVCIECKGRDLHYDRCYCLLSYTGIVQSKVITFKQAGYKHIGETFAHIMKLGLKEIEEPIDVIVPVPIHDTRRKERGFNQSEVLCTEIKDVPIDTTLLIRSVNTPHQTGLSRENREKNLIGCFAVPDKKLVTGKSILLVDDIYTTGSTLSECARTLKKAGAKKVYAMCLARAPYKLDNIVQ